MGAKLQQLNLLDSGDGHDVAGHSSLGLFMFQRLHREAAEEAKSILKTAEATAERIRENAEKAAEETIKRREQQATAKIAAAEAAMVTELRDKAATLLLPPNAAVPGTALA